MDKKLYDVCLRSGEGDDEIIFRMGLDKETIDMMGIIRKEDPANGKTMISRSFTPLQTDLNVNNLAEITIQLQCYENI